MTEWEELKSRILSRYDVEELCDVLGIGTEDIVDNFQELVYNRVSDLEIDSPEGYDEEAESHRSRSEDTEIQEEGY